MSNHELKFDFPRLNDYKTVDGVIIFIVIDIVTSTTVSQFPNILYSSHGDEMANPKKICTESSELRTQNFI